MDNYNRRTPSPLRFVSMLSTSLDNMLFHGDITDARNLLAALNSVLLYHDSLYRGKLEDESKCISRKVESDFDLPF